MKDRIIQTMCSHFGKDVDKSGNFPVHEAMWSMFMNDLYVGRLLFLG